MLQPGGFWALLGAAFAFTWQYGNPFLHLCVAVGLVALRAVLWLLVRHEEHGYEKRTGLRILPASTGSPRERTSSE